MSELAGVREIIDEEELESRLRCMMVRHAQWEGWFWGAGALGTTTPIRRSWAERQPQELGADVSRLLASGEAALRVYTFSENGTAIHRREQYNGRFTGKTYTQLASGGPIHAAEVTGITDVDIGRGRTLPLLSLMEFGNPPPEKEFAVSLSDLADYVQNHQVEIKVM